MKNNQFKTVDEYIATFPKEVQLILQQIRKIIKNSAPKSQEVISYQMPTYKVDGKNLVHFAGYKNHIGFYPVPSGIDKFAKELSNFRTGKGTLQFSLDQPIPYDLIEKVVKFRVEEAH